MTGVVTPQPPRDRVADEPRIVRAEEHVQPRTPPRLG
jgi:hypothetical protein